MNESDIQTTNGYTIRHISEVSPVLCPCGWSQRIIPASENRGYSFHVTTIRNAKLHYHERTQEVYYILNGTGTIELNEAVFPVTPGMTITIEAGTRHRIQADSEIQTIVLAIPGFDPSDEFLVPGD
ncbi:MAG: cupin domain-containing protein [Zavarzinella sp.]